MFLNSHTIIQCLGGIQRLVFVNKNFHEPWRLQNAIFGTPTWRALREANYSCIFHLWKRNQAEKEPLLWGAMACSLKSKNHHDTKTTKALRRAVKLPIRGCAGFIHSSKSEDCLHESNNKSVCTLLMFSNIAFFDSFWSRFIVSWKRNTETRWCGKCHLFRLSTGSLEYLKLGEKVKYSCKSGVNVILDWRMGKEDESSPFSALN